jgi:DNA ligase 1
MNRFIALTHFLDQEKDELIRLKALTNYLAEFDTKDSLWSVSLLTGKFFFRKIHTRKLFEIAKEILDFPEWLLDECISVTRDSTEALSLLLIPSGPGRLSVEECITKLILAVEAKGQNQRNILHDLWSKLPGTGIKMVNQILTNRFPHRFPHHVLGKAISAALDLDPYFVTFKLSQDWSPFSGTFEELFRRNELKECLYRPYPVYPPARLSSPSQVDLSREWISCFWLPEPQYQLIKRGELEMIWSENGELMNNIFPSLLKSFRKLGVDFVVTGQIILKENVLVPPFDSSDKQPKKRTVSPAPVFMANDLLEWNGENITSYPFEIRQNKLAEMIKSNSDEHPDWTLNDMMLIGNASDLESRLSMSGELKCSGLLIREKSGGLYGESSGFIVPSGKFLFSGALIYVQEMILQSVERHLELSIAVDLDGSILPVAKVKVGAKDQPVMFQFVRQFAAINTTEKFGPVRKVNPRLVFEISFEAIRVSNRHKSGIVLQNPRILRLEPDKLTSEIHKLEDLKQLL